jgi:hypothetical protein
MKIIIDHQSEIKLFLYGAYSPVRWRGLTPFDLAVQTSSSFVKIFLTDKRITASDLSGHNIYLYNQYVTDPDQKYDEKMTIREKYIEDVWPEKDRIKTIDKLLNSKKCITLLYERSIFLFYDIIFLSEDFYLVNKIETNDESNEVAAKRFFSIVRHLPYDLLSIVFNRYLNLPKNNVPRNNPRYVKYINKYIC